MSRRQFAKPKALGLAERIASRCNIGLHGAWDRLERNPVGSQVIQNERRAFNRRAAGWQRKVVRVTFAGRS